MAKDCIEVIVTPEFASKEKPGKLVFRGKPPAIDIRQEMHHGRSYVVKAPAYAYGREIEIVGSMVKEALCLTDAHQNHRIKYCLFQDGKKKIDIFPLKT
ncbi:MAG: hypothetical protein AABW79_00340 [Nanoarchaeota archaeon]